MPIPPDILNTCCSLQGAYGEAESIKLQDALIKEEEEAERLEDQRQASRLAAEREKKARKKVQTLSELLVAPNTPYHPTRFPFPIFRTVFQQCLESR